MEDVTNVISSLLVHLSANALMVLTLFQFQQARSMMMMRWDIVKLCMRYSQKEIFLEETINPEEGQRKNKETELLKVSILISPILLNTIPKLR